MRQQQDELGRFSICSRQAAGVLPLVRLKLVYESDTLCDDRPVVLGDTANREAVKREVERRVKERMILSRNRNYSRLVTASP